jgi:hypothetical protein
VVDGAHRVWIVVRQKQLTYTPVLDSRVMDQWLIAVDLTDAFAPTPVEISDVPGQDTVVQAERTLNFATHQVRPTGGRAGVRGLGGVRRGCAAAFPVNVSCGYDGTAGSGFQLTASHLLGHGPEPVDYRVRVPTAGDYRVGFRAYTFNAALFDLVAGERSYRVSFDREGSFGMVWLAQPVRLPAGEQTIRLVSVPGSRAAGCSTHSSCGARDGRGGPEEARCDGDYG